MLQLNAQIIYNKKIKKNYFEITLAAAQIAKIALPGQVVNIKVSDGIEPLLRRPLSIHRVGFKSKVSSLRSKEYIVMLYEVIGKGTEILARKNAGEYLDVIGPLGNGFKLDRGQGTPRLRSGQAVDRGQILVAGGMGTAPLVFLAERLVHSPQSTVHRKPLVLLGAKTKDALLCEKEFKELGCEVKVATDDGSRGFKGYVSDLLTKELSAIRYPLSAIYACGPTPMLKEISRISLMHNIPAQLSLEAHMACGIGACMGCVIKVKSQKLKVKSLPQKRDPAEYQSIGEKKLKVKSEWEYKRVCKDGPVFEANEIIW